MLLKQDLLKWYWDTLDELDFIVGEYVWNLAGFMTKQGIARMTGNRKGIFARDRSQRWSPTICGNGGTGLFSGE